MTVAGQMSGLPFRIAFRPPETATGTIGACALIAITKPPFLNGSSSPVRLRVPSGKMKNALPSRERVGRLIDGGPALVSVAALERHEPGHVETQTSTGSFRSSAL